MEKLLDKPLNDLLEKIWKKILEECQKKNAGTIFETILEGLSGIIPGETLGGTLGEILI